MLYVMSALRPAILSELATSGKLVWLGTSRPRLLVSFSLLTERVCVRRQTNVTSQAAFHTTLMDRLFSQVPLIPDIGSRCVQ